MRKMYLSELTMPDVVEWRRRVVAILRILYGCSCAADACYRWVVIGRSGGFLQHEPLPLMVGWMAPWFSFVHPHLFAVGGAVGETIVACCLVCGALTNVACGLGIFLTLLGYTTTGALGTVLEPGSFDLGILFVFVLIFLGLALGNAGEMYGVDGWLCGRLGRWSFLSSFYEGHAPVLRPGMGRTGEGWLRLMQPARALPGHNGNPPSPTEVLSFRGEDA